MEETVLSCHVGPKGQKQLTSLAASSFSRSAVLPAHLHWSELLSFSVSRGAVL